MALQGGVKVVCEDVGGRRLRGETRATVRLSISPAPGTTCTHATVLAAPSSVTTPSPGWRSPAGTQPRSLVSHGWLAVVLIVSPDEALVGAGVSVVAGAACAEAPPTVVVSSVAASPAASAP